MSTIIARHTLEVILNTLVCAGIIYCEAASQVTSDLDSGMDWEEVVNEAERYMQPSEFEAFSKAIMPWCIECVDACINGRKADYSEWTREEMNGK